MQIETLAWITDDEAEFWTSTSPMEKNDVSHHLSTSKDLSSNIISSDDLYFKTNNQLDTEIENQVSLLSNQVIQKQEQKKKDTVEKKQIFDIFQLNENVHLNKKNPEKTMGFLSRLFHQLTRSSSSEFDYLDDDVFIDIDETEIAAVVNNNADIDVSSNVENKTTDTIPFMNTIRSFIDELNEEKDVITGTIDEETLANRRRNRYNIPIEIWFQQDHPIAPPLAYIKPTLDTFVSTTTRDVPSDGTIIIPYLKNWRHNYTTNLQAKINEMLETTQKMLSSSGKGNSIKEDALITPTPVYK
ncbi:unnamed protein product [Rotaria sordida]|uniref:UEV domain-containing protein n=1 Tax=Rotaria sordida TaxID=392033 RepID=A0A818PUP5_9BILA|nr:unnamed protein product [Rotaria sordida]